jgi:prepilin-type N-terminal cleavage/methylation domain-containing protein
MMRGSAKGFSLIETLVALAIAAIVINGFYSALSTGSLLDRRASDQAEMVFVATNVMDRVGVDIPLRIGSDIGILQGKQWELVISNTPTDDMRLGAVYRGELLFVSVAVTDPAQIAAPVTLRGIRYTQTPL